MATFEMYTHLCSVLSISAEHLFHALRLLQQLAHGTLVLRDVIGRFLLGVKEPGEVVSQTQSDFEASQVAIEAARERQYNKKFVHSRYPHFLSFKSSRSCASVLLYSAII